MRLLVALFSLCLIVQSSCAAEAARSFDGRFWLALSQKEKDAFFSGETDCYLYDFKGPRHINGSRLEGVRRIDKYYSDNPGNQMLSVSEVIQKLSEPVKNTPPVADHAYFDGEFWRMLFTRAEKAAFVDGYWACRSKYMATSPSRSTDYYVQELSKHFGTNDDDPGEGNPATSNDKIGNVLVRLLDKK